MANPKRFFSRITKVEIDPAHTTDIKLYIDFYVDDGLRWYLMYFIDTRAFGVARRTGQEGNGRYEIPRRLRSFLISILPPEIIAHCTAVSLGVATTGRPPQSCE